MLNRMMSALGYEKRATEPGYDFYPYNNGYWGPGPWNRATGPQAFVTAGSVMSNLAVAVRCISLRSELLASVPLKMYRRLPNGERERVTDHPLADVLADLYNPLMTAFEGREAATRQLDTAGNAYARAERNSAGQVTALWPMEAGRVLVERLDSGRLRYRYTSNSGAVTLLQEDVLHIRASSDGDGLMGVSPISRARGALGLAINQAETSGAIAAQGLRPSGVVTYPGKLNEQARKNLAELITRSASGPAKAGLPLVLIEGATWAAGAFSAEDAELLESRKLGNEDVARIFGVPPASVGIATSVSYGSAQQAAADLVQNALAPLASRIEQALQRCLLTPQGRRTYIIEHDLSGLLRGDATSRWTSYKTAREIGVLSAPEIRRIENLGPLDPDQDYTPLRTTPQPAEPPIASTK